MGILPRLEEDFFQTPPADEIAARGGAKASDGGPRRAIFCPDPEDAGGRPARCRVRIYLPDDMRDAPVVVCSELPNNPGGSATNSAEVRVAGVIQNNKQPTLLVWIEYWPEESTEGQETFELVVFSICEVIERAGSGHKVSDSL